MSTQNGQIAKARRWGFPVRFFRNDSGATAVEFTLLSIPFAILVFAILESCISFAGQQLMANITDDVARQIRTGQLRPADITKESLETLICDRLEIIVAEDCPGLEVDLREFPTFAAAAAVRIKLTADRDLDTSDFDIKPGLSMSKNMLRVFYKWPIITDFMSKLVSNLKDGKTLHFATVTWQNEPFDD
ncbi:TadE/TadG family type IV pilus assembly protein [Mesorhizobium marinum]|uniref:TadE/TadG family type IV pilus assembly protein n=1 Tax=Mesorhizobium marinum TaxID=3228790 RepID=UPI0034659950